MLRNEIYDNEIIEIYNNVKFFSEKYLDEKPYLKNYLNEILFDEPLWLSIRNIVIAMKHDIFYLSKCKTCNKTLTFKQTIRNSKYCSIKCSAIDIDVKNKKKQNSELTCLKRYGVKSTFQVQEFRDKAKNTCLEKYGYENPNKNKEIRQKVEQTMIERYGVKNALQNKEVLKKSIETNLKNHGGIFNSKTIESKEKIKDTNRKKYGFDYFLQTDDFKQKSKETSKLLNDGFEHFSIKKSWEIIQKWEKYNIIPLFKKDEYEGLKTNKVYKWKCTYCNNEFEQRIYTTHFNYEFDKLPRCLNCYPLNGGTSYREIELLNFCKKYFKTCKKSFKNQLIDGFSLDIVIDEIKLAIEFNGSYWHSTKAWLNKHNSLDNYHNYHLNKVIKSNEKGYRLIHIWEDEWNSNKELIKKKLIDIFEGNEIIDYNQKLDRSWYNNLEGDFEELPPEIIIRDGFEVENCGYLIYIKNKNDQI